MKAIILTVLFLAIAVIIFICGTTFEPQTYMGNAAYLLPVMYSFVLTGIIWFAYEIKTNL